MESLFRLQNFTITGIRQGVYVPHGDEASRSACISGFGIGIINSVTIRNVSPCTLTAT